MPEIAAEEGTSEAAESAGRLPQMPQKRARAYIHTLHTYTYIDT